MNIVHVITRLIIGGAQENTVLTCRGLVERGHRVTLVAGAETGPEGSLWPMARASGAELVPMPPLVRAVRPHLDWRARKEMIRLFRAIKPDVVHTHSSKAGILGRMAAARAGIPAIMHTIHGMSFNRTQSPLTRATYRCLERKAGTRTTAFISVADAMTAQAVAAGLGPVERFTTIRSGMEVESFAPDAEKRRRSRASWGVEDSHVVVGTIARLFENKGYEEILSAMPIIARNAPHVRFVWVGDGRHRERYVAQLDRLALRDRVILTGLVPPEQVAEFVNGFDVLLHASRWEGLPRAVVQGLINEKPAVSFDNDGAPEVVVHGITGLLAPLGDCEGLAGQVVRLAGDAKLRSALGREGRSRCVQAFDWRHMVEQIEQVYAKALSGRGSA